MGITVNFDLEKIRSRFNNLLDEIEEMQLEILQELGEMCVAHARSIPKEQGFEDQTGNLRSSIGYAVFVDGVAIHSSYPNVNVTAGERKVQRKRKLKDGTIKTYEAKIKVGGDGAIGAKAGEELAQKVGEQTQGFCLVVTAGMHYAEYLEAKGKDVIASAELLAERELPRMLEELKRNIEQATS